MWHTTMNRSMVAEEILTFQTNSHKSIHEGSSRRLIRTLVVSIKTNHTLTGSRTPEEVIEKNTRQLIEVKMAENILIHLVRKKLAENSSRAFLVALPMPSTNKIRRNRKEKGRKIKKINMRPTIKTLKTSGRILKKTEGKDKSSMTNNSIRQTTPIWKLLYSELN